MDPDFKPQVQSNNSESTSIPVNVRPQAVASAPVVGGATPSLVNSTFSTPPVKPVVSDVATPATPEPTPVIQAAAAEMADSDKPKNEVTPGKKTKKSGKGLKRFLLTLFVLLLMAGSAVGGYFAHDSVKDMLDKDDSATKTSTTTTPKKAVVVKPLTAVDIIAKVKGSTTLTSAATVDKVTFSREKVNGYTYYIAPAATDTTTLSYVPKTGEYAAGYAKIKATLAGLGLKAVKETAGTATTNASGTYADANVLCSVTGISANLTVACLDKTSYASVATKLKPYMDLYTASSTTDKTFINSGKMVVTDAPVSSSKSSGYSLVTLNIGSIDGGGAAALFYQTPDMQWHYFRSTQQALLCTDYNTSDLKKAYLETPCFTGSGSTQSSVKV